MLSSGRIAPSTLSVKDLLWQIHWEKARCTFCGRCTAVCPVSAIELGVHRRRLVQTSMGLDTEPANVFQVYHGIRQRTDPAYACVGCGMCTLICPNDCILPFRSDEADKLRFHINRGGQPRRRGGRRLFANSSRACSGPGRRWIRRWSVGSDSGKKWAKSRILSC